MVSYPSTALFVVAHIQTAPNPFAHETGGVEMKKFCGNCGAKLHRPTGLCPRCNDTAVKKYRRWKRAVTVLVLLLVLVSCGFLLIHFDVVDKPNIKILKGLKNSVQQFMDEHISCDKEPAPVECRHIWADVSCETPKNCTLCGKTEGVPLGHQLTEANFQTPSCCTVCGKTVGQPLTPYFEENGYVCNLTELNRPYDYHTRSQADADKTVSGKLIVTDYEVFPGDDTHEALEGYEWRRVKFHFRIPTSELSEGGTIGLYSFDYYRENGEEDNTTLSSGECVKHAVNWNGIEYDDGLLMFAYLESRNQYDNDIFHTNCWFFVCESSVRVPSGYDGTIFAAFNRNSEIEQLMESGAPIGVIDAALLSSEDTLTFRLG